MIIYKGSHTYTIPDTALILRGESFYAPVDIDVRGQTFRQYIKVDPPAAQNFETGLLYTCELPPRALLVLTVPPWLAAGINRKLSVGSVIHVVQPTLWHEGLKVA